MISQGTAASISLTVTEQDTAIVLGSGDVAVLGTPRVVALCEEAAVAALAGFLPDGATTVGTSISIDHLAPTGVDGTVTATATVTEVEGKKVSFTLVVKDGDKLAARGTHTRLVVDRERFESSATRDRQTRRSATGGSLYPDT
jgi:predicted thioesterase